jgi:peptidoglycan hydrolase-like protein with peptidoglycan-binding domain
MSVKYYNYPADKDVQLSAHFKMGEFVDASDYTSAPFPSDVPIDSDLIDVLEQVREHFGCTSCNINSGYRTQQADKAVGGSGSGPHTYGCAADVYFYKNGQPLESRLIACYLQDIGAHGIGYCCGGNYYGTHIDSLSRVWHGDERDYSVTVSDYYSYTGTTKAEVYGSSGGSSAPTGNSDDIKTVQDWLGVDVDGIYGSQTKTALIKELQTVLNDQYGANLTVDGVFGNQTASAIQSLKKGSTGDLTAVLQALLNCHGYDTGGLDGDFGAQTDKAVRAFQSDNGLYVDGVAGKATFGALTA